MHSNVYKPCRGQEIGTTRERKKENTRKFKQQEKKRNDFVHAYVSTGLPLASHSMMMLSRGSTIQSFADCFTIVGGCFTGEGGQRNTQQRISVDHYDPLMRIMQLETVVLKFSEHIVLLLLNKTSQIYKPEPITTLCCYNLKKPYAYCSQKQ